MHEVSIAQALVDQAKAAAAREGMASVRRVGVCVGPYSGVCPEALTFAFEILRDGPVLGGASLDVRAGEEFELMLEWIEGDT
jgi:hydrogenase nickel incorporation protein HypA/HybF